MSAEDEARALEYRRQVRRRNAHRLAMERQLAGNPARAQQVRDAWAPVRDRDIDIPDIPEYGIDDEDYKL